MSIVQYKTNEGPGGASINGITTAFDSNVSSGSAIIAFYTLSDFAGTHTDLAASDTLSNTFTNYSQQNTSATGGAATVSALVAPGPSSTGANTVATLLSSIGDVEDWQAAFIIEVGNTHTSPLVTTQGNTQNGLGTGTDNIVSGNIVISSGQVPCTIIAISMATNGTSVPVGGTGMTHLADCWGFGSAPNLGCVAYRNITTAGTYQALFSNTGSTDDYATVAVVIQTNAAGVARHKNRMGLLGVG
jgi:hypothetical protein